ncbi:MAG: acetylxylan esterase, partial [Sphingomonadales bacterium]
MRFAMMFAALACAVLPASAQQDYSAANADRQAMLDRLGIASTRPGADGLNPQAPNAANYDEAKAGEPALPALLRFADGRTVKSARDWVKRRGEIVEAFDREIYGRVPAGAPKIAWRVTRQESGVEAGIPVVK